MSGAGQAVRRPQRAPWRERLPWRRLSRWGGSLVVLGAMLVGAAQLLHGLQDVDRFPVRRVAVDGPLAHTDRQRLEAVVTEFSERGFYQADLPGLRRRLLDLPWIRRVAIRKVWPDQLRIHLLEHQPVAVWNGDGLLSEAGVVFRPDEPQLRSLAQGRGLPQLHGPADQADLVWSTFQRWNELLGMHGLQAVSIRRDARGGWALGLRQSVRLLLGRHDMEPRLRRWLRVQEGVGAVALARVAQIDLRYTNGFAVAWKAGPPEQADSGVTDAENG